MSVVLTRTSSMRTGSSSANASNRGSNSTRSKSSRSSNNTHMLVSPMASAASAHRSTNARSSRTVAKAPPSMKVAISAIDVFAGTPDSNSNDNQLPSPPVVASAAHSTSIKSHAKLDKTVSSDAATDSTDSSSDISPLVSRSSSSNNSDTTKAAPVDDNNACDDNQFDNDACDDSDASPPPPPASQSKAPVSSSRAHTTTRHSESAVPEKFDPAFVLPVRPQDYKSTLRSSLVSFDPPPAAVHNNNNNKNNNNNNGGRRTTNAGNNTNNNNNGLNSNFVDFNAPRDSESDMFGFFDDTIETSRLSNSIDTPTLRFNNANNNNPYDGISIDVTSHSVNNQGVVLYHVDIKGPDGLLSTYTIRRRYKAFKELHEKLQLLITEFATRAKQQQSTDKDDGSSSDAFAAANVPDSPHTQARKHERLQQIAEHSVLSAATFTFPALPSGGVWSYLKRHDVRLVEQRKKRFEEILRIAIRHPATRTSAMLDSFLSVAPSLISQRGGSSYVSLQDYSVPVFDRQRESIERKQLKLRLIEGRRQRTSSEASSSMS